MKLKSLFILILLGSIVNILGQGKNSKICLDASMNYALLGEGDYIGFYYDNSVIYSIKPTLELVANLGFIISSNDGKNNIEYSHSNSYIIGDVLLRLIPVKLKKIDFFFGLGLSNRCRSELKLQSIFIENDETDIEYSNKVTYDYGYLGQIGVGFWISPKAMILLNGEMHGYNKGTGIYSLGVGMRLKL